MADEDDTEYEWIAKSECPVCTGMEGVYESPPTRPHPHCQCTIVTYLGTYGDYACSNDWYFDYIDNEFVGTYPDEIAILHWVVTVWCWDGSAYEEEVAIEYDPTEGAFWHDSMVAQLQDAAYDIARSECPPMPQECLGVP
jgi:hypothetical protein